MPRGKGVYRFVQCLLHDEPLNVSKRKDGTFGHVRKVHGGEAWKRDLFTTKYPELAKSLPDGDPIWLVEGKPFSEQQILKFPPRGYQPKKPKQEATDVRMTVKDVRDPPNDDLRMQVRNLQLLPPYPSLIGQLGQIRKAADDMLAVLEDKP